ncbi:MAG: class I SAM-dependent methyltransferase [Proteobacteria bacterium]|nr:class I SAM-dependent methyltransferase [Pseudomonadota bacterium]
MRAHQRADEQEAERTVRSYEAFAREYDKLVDPHPPPEVEDALRRFAACLPSEGQVLELGTGTGRDADFLETLRLRVRRTDATRAFLDLLAERGRPGELLNMLTDEFGGPYEGVLALCVLIHAGRANVSDVLRKVYAALKPEGAFLVSMRKGVGETRGKYLTVYWLPVAFAAMLGSAGLRVDWQRETVDSDGDTWITYLARRPA